MIAPLKNFIDRLRGNGRYAITTPPMDGVLQPNNRIEEAPLFPELSAPDNLVHAGGETFVTTHSTLMTVGPAGLRPLVDFPPAINALATSGAGAMVIALADGQIILRGGKHDGAVLYGAKAGMPSCTTAICFSGEETLYLCQGSSRHPLADWKRDLMEHNAAGSIWKLDLAARTFTEIAAGLAFPYGILARADGSLVVSESWRSRLVVVDASGTVEPLLEDLPGYPARIVPRHDGRGAWLSMFVPRSQLIEFVLREDRFCQEMLRTIPPDLWMASSLTAPHSFLEPLQGGGLKQLGVIKPWAPTRSFGLVISLDDSFEPIASWQSRADGTRHGITSVVDTGGGLIVASKGGNVVVTLTHREGMPA